MFVVSVVVFALVRLSGDPIQIMMPAEATQADIELMRASLGLDRAWAVQYWRVLGPAGQGGLGPPVRLRRPPLHLLAARHRRTPPPGGPALLLVVGLAPP